MIRTSTNHTNDTNVYWLDLDVVLANLGHLWTTDELDLVTHNEMTLTADGRLLEE